MNITLALDEKLVEKAREIARQQGRSLNDLIRAYLESVAGRHSTASVIDELEQLWREQPGHSGGRRISRDEAYEERR